MKRSLATLTVLFAIGFLSVALSESDMLILPRDLQCIGEEAFFEDQSLDTVIISEGLTFIGPRAFSRSSLKKISIPDGVQVLEEQVFMACENLTGISLPDSLEVIKFCALHQCRSLQEITLPARLLRIEQQAFDDCDALERIDIPEGTEFLGDYAFFSCDRLSEVTLPSSLSSIGECVFSGCAPNLALIVQKGSYAEYYCIQNSLNYKIVGIADYSWPAVEPQTHKVLVINYDPIFEQAGGKRWHELLSWWNDPHVLAAGFQADMHDVSHGYLTYEIVEWIDVEGMPEGENGFIYDKAEYYDTLMAANEATDGAYWQYAGWTDYGFNYDYEGCLEKFDLCRRVNAGEIDEVWVFAGPMHGNTMYETRMCGNNAYWCNSPGLEKDCRRFVIYGFNYEREVAEMLHDAGHRMESVLHEAFGWTDYSKNYEDYTDWEKFSAYDMVCPGKAGIGLIHFAPNSTDDYDWYNTRSVASYCDDWLNYPNLTGIQRTVDCSEWNGDQRGFIKWWFSHIPVQAGTNPQTGKYNNWWMYFTLKD